MDKNELGVKFSREKATTCMMIENEIELKQKILEMEIESMDLSVRSYNLLKRYGFNTVNDITEITYLELCQIPNIQEKSAKEIVEKIMSYGLQMMDESARTPIEIDVYSVGNFANWTCSIDVLTKQTKRAKLNPDCLLIVETNDNKAKVVLCWYEQHEYMMRVLTNIGYVYVSANVYLTIDFEFLKIIDGLKLLKETSIEYIHKKHNEIIEKEQAKSELRKQRKVEINRRKELAKQNEHKRTVAKKYAKLRKRLGEPSKDAWEYDLAVINNDKKTIKAIEKKVGHDPRPRIGCKSGSKLKQVTNPRPCIGGRVSPK